MANQRRIAMTSLSSAWCVSGGDRSPCALNWYEGKVLVKGGVLGWEFNVSIFPLPVSSPKRPAPEFAPGR